MTDQTGFSAGAVRRALVMGIGLFAVFVVAGGGLWLVGAALGLSNLQAFFVGMCGGPLLISGVILLWFYSRPPERRQTMLGVAAPPAAAPQDERSASDEPGR